MWDGLTVDGILECHLWRGSGRGTRRRPVSGTAGALRCRRTAVRWNHPLRHGAAISRQSLRGPWVRRPQSASGRRLGPWSHVDCGLQFPARVASRWRLLMTCWGWPNRAASTGTICRKITASRGATRRLSSGILYSCTLYRYLHLVWNNESEFMFNNLK